jgi:hypothetical protein
LTEEHLSSGLGIRRLRPHSIETLAKNV